MAQTVVFEGQWSIVRFLKPFKNFEQVYQGKPAATPIAFPGVLDGYAERGLPGYDPNLLAGMTVPLGARIQIWIPLCISDDEVSPSYQYQIIWRYRTIADYLVGAATGQVTHEQSYSSYHLGIGPFGQAESLTDPATKRYFLPGALKTVEFPQAQPTGGNNAVVHLYGQVIQPLATPVWVPPLTPKGQQGAWQQGVYPSAGTNTTGPSFMVYEFDAEGDEFTILASVIAPTDGQTWNFTSSEPGDRAFSETYGNNNGAANASPYTGILVAIGTR